MKTKTRNTLSKHDLGIRRKCIKGGLSIGFGNGYATAYRVIESICENTRDDKAFSRAAGILLDALTEWERELVWQHEYHLDDYIA